jgi:hypothetical protein
MGLGYSDYELSTESVDGIDVWVVPETFSNALFNIRRALSGETPPPHFVCIRDKRSRKILWCRDPVVRALNELLEET